MKSPLTGPPGRRARRAYATAAAVWVVSLVAALVLLPPGGQSAQAAASSAVTVAGPPVWIPVTGTTDGTDGMDGTQGADGSVTVDQTQDLTHQVLHVTWSGFTPTIGGIAPQLFSNKVSYAVRVYECRGTDPKITDCYGSSLYNADASLGFNQGLPPDGTTTPDFPSNMVLAATHADGTGDAFIEVWTAKESQTLGCDSTHPCSIVVEPNYGGDALGLFASGNPPGSPDCANHQVDTGFYQVGYEATDNVVKQNTGGPDGDLADGEACAWQNRAVVPLHFAPTPDDCKSHTADVTSEGLPMLDRAMEPWIAGACLASSSPVTVQYSADLTEPVARADFLAGGSGADIALTSYPADPATKGKHPYTYTPLANGAVTVAFLIDDKGTGRLISGMKLNARLLAKMLTQSYDYEGAHVPTVAGNPQCVLDDPEFRALNPSTPSVTWPTCADLANFGAATSIPLVTGGRTDLVQAVTTWIAGDPDARAFLGGAADPWGMKVDTKYQAPTYSYPVDSFVPQDSTGLPDGSYDPTGFQADYGKMKSFEWSPIQRGLDQLARNMFTAQATCQEAAIDLAKGGHDSCPQQTVGSRAMFALVDSGRAAAYRWPTASLLNPAGDYVAATPDSMLAAVADMKTDSATGTQALPYGDAGATFAQDGAAYPLTLVQYAMAPTSGITTAKAAKIAQFLRTVTSSSGGQVEGPNPGQMPPGFAPLTAPQRTQAAAAEDAVAADRATATSPTSGGSGPVIVTGGSTVINNYYGSSGGGSGGATGGVSGGTSGGTSSGGSASGSGGLLPSGSPTSLAPVAAGAPNPDQAGIARWVLPILLIVGAVLFLVGPLGLLATSGGLRGVRLSRKASGGLRGKMLSGLRLPRRGGK